MKKTTKIAAAVGAAGATMAGAAGAYYLYGSEKAAQNRRAVSTWMRRAEREIVHEAKRLKNATFNDQNVQQIIDEVTKRYMATRSLDPQDVQRFVEAVRSSWKDAAKAVNARSGKQSAPKATKKKTATAKTTTARKSRSRKPSRS